MKNKSKNKNNIIKFPSSVSKLERQIEAILFAASEPLDVETIEKRIQTNSNITKLLEKIKDSYKNRGINLVCIRNKWSFRTAEDLSKLMSLQKSTQRKLSKATIETLSIHFNIQKLSDLPTIDELGSAGLIDTSNIDKSIFGTGKFFKEQSINEKQNIYEEIDEAIKKAPEEEK